MSNFFLFFQLDFFQKKQCKNYPLIIFCFLSLLLLFFLYQPVILQKKEYMSIHGHILYII